MGLVLNGLRPANCRESARFDQTRLTPCLTPANAWACFPPARSPPAGLPSEIWWAWGAVSPNQPMKTRLRLLLLALLACPLLPAAAQAPLIWQQRTDVGSPGAYENAALAFHDRQGVLLLFGGVKYESGGILGTPSNDLWQYDGAAWQPVTVTGPRPAARSQHGLVYDPVDQRVLLFGGDGGSYLNDLWAFDFTGPAIGAWVRLTDLPAAGRRGAILGYDAWRDHFVVVGGIKQGTTEQLPVGGQAYGGVYPATRETWVWNRAGWVAGPLAAEYINGPAQDNFDYTIMAGPRAGALVHHTASGQTVLLAEHRHGMTGIPVANVFYGAGGMSFYEGSHWTANTGGNVYLANWSRLNVQMVSSSTRVVAAYDPGRQRVVAFGAGRENSEEYTGNGWAGATDATRGTFGPLPAARVFPCLGHDARRGVTVFFGGRASVSEPGDTWELVENPAAPFLITTNLATAPLEFCQGETLMLQGGATGVGPFTVRWFRDTDLVPGTNGFQLVLTNLVPAQAGAYTFEVSDSSGRKLRSQATPVVVHAPPQVSAPQARRVVPGESFALEVSVTSTLPVTYQWYRGGDLLPGATGAVFSKASAVVADAGIYTVFVATRCTTVSSSGARVYVGPLINQHPAAPTNREVMAGPLTLTVTADGAGAQVGTYTVSGGGTHPNRHAPDSPTNPLPMNFTWRHEGVPLVAGPNVLFSNTPLSSTLIILQPDYEHEGAYDCVVADASGPAYAEVTPPTFVILRPLAPPYLTLLQGRGPEPRAHAGMVYDSSRRRTVLFGGEAYGVNPRSGSPNLGYFNSNDTWEWDGQSWVKRNPSTRPPALTQFGIAYDSRRGRTVVFGGYKFAPPNYLLGSQVISNEIWEWDGSDWTQVFSANPPPQGRTRPMLCFDSVRGEVLMLGGSQLNPEPPDYYGSRKILWAWDGTQWTQRGTIPGGGASDYVGGEHGFAFDAQRGVAVLFGPFGEGTYPVWEWNGATWNKVMPPASLRVIDSRQSGGAFYDSVRRRVGLAMISNSLFPSVGTSLPVVVWWDGREFLRGDTRTLDDLNGLVLTNGVESGPWGQVSDLVAFDAHRRCLVWQDMPQFLNAGPAWTRAMHFSAKVKPVHQPREVRFTAGQNLQLPSINAGERPLVQQWFKDGATLFDDAHWNGTATPRLGIQGATAADVGDYTLRVTGPYNQVTTDPIQLRLQGTGISLVVQGGGLELYWPGATGILETAPTANGPWTALYGITSPFNVALDEAWRFYRVRYP